MTVFESRRPRIAAPEAPSVVAGHGRAAILTIEGELLTVSADAAGAILRERPPLVVHAPATWRRLGMRPMPAYDLLDLFAFAMPARHVSPTPRGLALALDLDLPAAGLEPASAALPGLAMELLGRLSASRAAPANRDAAGLAKRMGQAGWGWAPFIAAALGQPEAPASAEGLRVWRRLPEWEDAAPLPAPSAHGVTPAEARRRLVAMLGPEAEQRPGQADYAGAASAAFAAREIEGQPHVVLAEAGTGTGKTLGYLAPAVLWAERNQATVWISTFTKHLQRQIEAELARVFPDPAERRRRAVVRKGRENYLCLLNLEDAAHAALGGGAASAAIPLGLISRWAMATADGDLSGGDLPGWFAELFGPAAIGALTDRRGECIHAACAHWRRCFVEHTIRRARGADFVLANHALVMSQAAHDWNWGGGLEDGTVPLRYVFDEGHHLFDAADTAFASELSGTEAAELRRWLLGAEGGRSRARGLRRRIEELLIGHPDLETSLEAALQAARALPAPGWSARLAQTEPELGGIEAGRPNPTEVLLHLMRTQVLARAREAPPGVRAVLEADLHPAIADLPDAAGRLCAALARIAEPLVALRKGLAARLEDEAEELDSATRNRIDAACRTIGRRALDRLAAWRAMLRAIVPQLAPPGDPDGRAQVIFMRLDRREAGDRDVGLFRHWLDPTVPFAAAVAAPAHGLLVTSATLRDSGKLDPEAAWSAAEARVGAHHLAAPAIRATVGSPFDYAAQTRAFIVTDLATTDPGSGSGAGIALLAAAYRALFLAAGGGALGLFTAISRLRAVHARIAPDLEAAGIAVLAQHVDAMDNATLVDVFRTEEESCLLGTDAMRDGVDVPGRALRLVVFEKVPWPRPDILHRERRAHLSQGDPGGYDDRIARLRLRQAFGRLIRQASDRGVFVLLDRRTPGRLLSAFPPGVAPRRVGLAEAVAETGAFLRR